MGRHLYERYGLVKMEHYRIRCQQHCLLWGKIKLFRIGKNIAVNLI